MPFDPRAVKALTPDSHLTIDEYPGLRITRTQSGWTWGYRFKVGGQMKQTRIGKWPALSLADAVSAWNGLRAQKSEGVDLIDAKRQAKIELAQRQAEPEAISVGELCRRYLDRKVRLSRGDEAFSSTERILGDINLRTIKGRLPHTISRREAHDLIETTAHRAPTVAKKLRAELGAAWSYGLDAGIVKENTPNHWRDVLSRSSVLKSRGRPRAGRRPGKPVKRVLSPLEVHKVLQYRHLFPPNAADAVTIYLCTGARGAEFLTMHKDEVRWEADGVLWWTCPKQHTKNRNVNDAGDYRVPLFGMAEEIVLRRMAETDGYIFPGKRSKKRKDGRGHLTQRAVGVATWAAHRAPEDNFGKARGRLDMPVWAPHDLRRTARTFLAAMDCPTVVAELIIGHIQTGVAGVYDLHKYDKQKKVWLKKLTALMSHLALSNAVISDELSSAVAEAPTFDVD
jgi:integrase